MNFSNIQLWNKKSHFNNPFLFCYKVCFNFSDEILYLLIYKETLKCSLVVWCPGKPRTCPPQFGTNYMLTLWKLVRLPTHHTGDLLIIGISKQKNICSPGVFSVEEILPCISVGMLVLVIVSARWYRNKYYSGGSSKLKETENIIVNNIKLRNIAVISDSV